MIKKLLIANRGEIACRIIRTCRQMGIRTVAVFSDADRNAKHVREADSAIHIGGAAPGESYLKVDAIIAAARNSGADAIHPGYGFLSENPDLVRACGEHELIFVGPTVKTIEQMGSKAEAKALMVDAGVPTVPGYHGDQQDDAYLLDQANQVGFPLMIKAAAGGGGKGMRIVREADAFAAELASAKREAINAFGDDQVILERYIEHPRHVEVQIFGDQHGNIVHLYERDCSSQRRYQKVIEECPAADLRAEQRQAMLEAAVEAARAVDYVNAGTVEFIVDQQQHFYFMEMNTRLQVEHPVTEMVTGQDLVAWQLKVAAGQPIPLKQHEITCNGHAFEARIYAEDPDSGFLPSSGKIHWLQATPDARVDASVDQGDEVTVFYDPMIAKLIVHGPDRQQALIRLQHALAGFALQGPKTNLDFLMALAKSEELDQATMHTALLDREFERIMPVLDTPPNIALVATAVAHLLNHEASSQARQRTGNDPYSPWASSDGWRLGAQSTQSFYLVYKDQHQQVIASGARGRYGLTINESSYQIEQASINGNALTMMLDGTAQRLTILCNAPFYQVEADGRLFELREEDRFDIESGSGADDHRILAPMPGRIVAIKAAVGDVVEAGDELMIMEAMKMELSLTAPMSGSVAAIHFETGEFVEADTLLAELEETSE